MTDYDDFAVDCFNLWRAGEVYLPTVADAYSAASQYLSWTYERVDEPTTFSNTRATGQSQAYQAWRELRDLTQAILGHTGQNLYQVGAAMRQAAIDYAAQDSEHANSLGSVEKQLNDQIEDFRNEVAKDRSDPDTDDLFDAPPLPTDPDIPDSDIVTALLPELKD